MALDAGTWLLPDGTRATLTTKKLVQRWSVSEQELIEAEDIADSAREMMRQFTERIIEAENALVTQLPPRGWMLIRKPPDMVSDGLDTDGERYGMRLRQRMRFVPLDDPDAPSRIMDIGPYVPFPEAGEGS